jgi:hypothetical protein
MGTASQLSALGRKSVSVACEPSLWSPLPTLRGNGFWPPEAEGPELPLKRSFFPCRDCKPALRPAKPRLPSRRNKQGPAQFAGPRLIWSWHCLPRCRPDAGRLLQSTAKGYEEQGGVRIEAERGRLAERLAAQRRDHARGSKWQTAIRCTSARGTGMGDMMLKMISAKVAAAAIAGALVVIPGRARRPLLGACYRPTGLQ